MADLYLRTTRMHASSGGQAAEGREPREREAREACRGRRQEEPQISPRGHPTSRSVSVSRRNEGGTFPLDQPSSMARDVKAVADAQGRLVRVIEDVSQELTQRLWEHDQRLAEQAAKQQSLQEALYKVQTEEAARHESLTSKYLRLRNGDGDAAARLRFLESKIVSVEKGHSSLVSKHADLDQAVQRHLPGRIQDLQVTQQKYLQDLHQKVLSQMEEQRTEFFQLHGQASSRSNANGLVSLQKQYEQHRSEMEARLQASEAASLPQLQHLESTLLQQLSSQLSAQLQNILQQQLEQHVQPQLEQQVQQHLKAHYSGLKELRETCHKEVSHRKELSNQLLELQRLPKQLQLQLNQRVQELEANVAKGQEALRQEASKREQHLAELQDAAQRLAHTATQRAQASTEAHAHVFSESSSLASRLSVVEGELQSLQRQEKERQQKRIARLEEDLARSPLPSPRARDHKDPKGSERGAFTAPSATAKDAAESSRDLASEPSNLLRALDELRVQFFAELTDTRKQAHQLSGRISRCEADLAELQDKKPPGAVPYLHPQGSPRPRGSESSCPTTPDWPASVWSEQGGGPRASHASSTTGRPFGLPPVPSSDATRSGLATAGSPAPAPGVAVPAMPQAQAHNQRQGHGYAQDETLWRPADSPTRSSPKDASPMQSKGSPGAAPFPFGQLPEGPQLYTDGTQDSPSRVPSARFGVLPPPKVTPATPLPLQAG